MGANIILNSKAIFKFFLDSEKNLFFYVKKGSCELNILLYNNTFKFKTKKHLNSSNKYNFKTQYNSVLSTIKHPKNICKNNTSSKIKVISSESYIKNKIPL